MFSILMVLNVVGPKGINTGTRTRDDRETGQPRKQGMERQKANKYGDTDDRTWK